MRQKSFGGLFSAALSRASRLVGVTHHRILQSPDFPPARYGLGTKNAASSQARNMHFSKTKI